MALPALLLFNLIVTETLFLYVDILGFSELVEYDEKTRVLFEILDGARLHEDSNFVSIVFSDTIVAYNRHRDLAPRAKSVELMYLIEFTQEILYRLIGTGIAFRAVITEGRFTHYRLKNFQAYYGPALVNAYRAEKEIKAVGLFLDRRLRPLNRIFRAEEYSPQFDFVFLIHTLRGFLSLLEPCSPDSYPLPRGAMDEYEHYIYPELMHCREVYWYFRHHKSAEVRKKYQNTWRMYEKAFPGFMTALRRANFDPRAIGTLNWGPIRKAFALDHPYAEVDLR